MRRSRTQLLLQRYDAEPAHISFHLVRPVANRLNGRGLDAIVFESVSDSVSHESQSKGCDLQVAREPFECVKLGHVVSPAAMRRSRRVPRSQPLAVARSRGSPANRLVRSLKQLRAVRWAGAEGWFVRCFARVRVRCRVRAVPTVFADPPPPNLTGFGGVRG